MVHLNITKNKKQHLSFPVFLPIFYVISLTSSFCLKSTDFSLTRKCLPFSHCSAHFVCLQFHTFRSELSWQVLIEESLILLLFVNQLTFAEINRA